MPNQILIPYLLEVVQTGLECARQVAQEAHEKYAGYKPNKIAAVDAEVKQLEDAVALLTQNFQRVLDEFDEEAERTKFEAWCWNDGPYSPNFFTERNELGDYVSDQTNGAWQAWLHLERTKRISI